jgi:hypothetical protein
MKRTSVALLAAGVISLVSLASASSAHADWRDRQRDIRRELSRDQAELERDREDLSRMYRNGANRREIDRKKAEIRQDMREVAEGRDRLNGGYYGYNRADNSWWNWGNGWWGNGDRDRYRDRWRYDYRHD